MVDEDTGDESTKYLNFDILLGADMKALWEIFEDRYCLLCDCIKETRGIVWDKSGKILPQSVNSVSWEELEKIKEKQKTTRRRRRERIRREREEEEREEEELLAPTEINIQITIRRRDNDETRETEEDRPRRRSTRETRGSRGTSISNRGTRGSNTSNRGTRGRARGRGRGNGRGRGLSNRGNRGAPTRGTRGRGRGIVNRGIRNGDRFKLTNHQLRKYKRWKTGECRKGILDISQKRIIIDTTLHGVVRMVGSFIKWDLRSTVAGQNTEGVESMIKHRNKCLKNFVAIMKEKIVSNFELPLSKKQKAMAEYAKHGCVDEFWGTIPKMEFDVVTLEGTQAKKLLHNFAVQHEVFSALQLPRNRTKKWRVLSKLITAYESQYCRICKDWVENYKEHASRKWCEECLSWDCVEQTHKYKRKLRHGPIAENFSDLVQTQDFQDKLQAQADKILELEFSFMTVLRDHNRWKQTSGQSDLDITHYIHHTGFHMAEQFKLLFGHTKWFSQEDMEKKGDMERQSGLAQTSRGGGRSRDPDKTSHIGQLMRTQLRKTKAETDNYQSKKKRKRKNNVIIHKPNQKKIKVDKSFLTIPKNQQKKKTFLFVIIKKNKV